MGTGAAQRAVKVDILESKKAGIAAIVAAGEVLGAETGQINTLEIEKVEAGVVVQEAVKETMSIKAQDTLETGAETQGAVKAGIPGTVKVGTDAAAGAVKVALTAVKIMKGGTEAKVAGGAASTGTAPKNIQAGTIQARKAAGANSVQALTAPNL